MAPAPSSRRSSRKRNAPATASRRALQARTGWIRPGAPARGVAASRRHLRRRRHEGPIRGEDVEVPGLLCDALQEDGPADGLAVDQRRLTATTKLAFRLPLRVTRRDR